MNVKIMSDSASDLPKELIDLYDIDVLPLTIIGENSEYKDSVTITPEQIFKNMREGASFKTSQVTSNDFYENFDKYFQDGRECIYLSLSSNLSGCFQSAQLAKDQIIEKYGDTNQIHTVDTKCASLGIGLIVLEAAKMASEGIEAKEILNMIDLHTKNMDHIFTVFDLDYLQRGGRLKKSSAILGNLLNIYPILQVVDGNLQVLETVRGRKKHMKRIMELVESRGKNLSNQTVGIVYGDNPEIAEELKVLFQEKFGTKDFIIRPVGAVIGAHTGPEMFSLFFLKN